MAEIVIRIYDEGDDAKVKLDADPQIDLRDPDSWTNAQFLAVHAMSAIDDAAGDSGGECKTVGVNEPPN